jgi:phage tail sheath protein FI
LSDAVDRGITVTEIAAMDQPIDVSPETTAAFVGRALRGPLNTPVLIRSVGEFQRRFGESWSRSSLGPAVRQFFEHGGRQLYVVRVANNARGAMLCLPASGSALVLRAVEPGSTEQIRAAVDYDGIAIDDDQLFNLTLQRINPATGHIEDQEFFRKVSWQQESAEFVGDALLASGMARVERPYPGHRPVCTAEVGWEGSSPYVEPVQSGTDGTELSDYDLVGSRKAQTGLFALEQVENFDLLYLPPPGKGIDTGPTAILAGERYCRDRGAMLVVDPRGEWTSAAEAAGGVRDLGYGSPYMLGYYPRVHQRGDGDIARVAGGAIAGLLCKLDRTAGPWGDLDQSDLGLQRALMPAVHLDEADVTLLQRTGLNVIGGGDAGRFRVRGALTMGRGSESHRPFSRLPVQRFCLRIVSTIADATRWAVFAQDDDGLLRHVRAQVTTYLSCLNDLDAFVDDHFLVQCGTSVDRQGGRTVSIIVAFHPVCSAERISMTLHVTASGCRIGSAAFAPSPTESPITQA